MGRRGKPSKLTSAERRGIQSVEVGVRILASLAALPDAASLRTISQAAEMPSTKTHRYLSSFVRSGLVQQDLATGDYDLGPLALSIGLEALRRIDIVEVSFEVMRSITDKTGITSLLCVWGERGPTIVRWRRGQQNLITSLALGSVLPVLQSATGLVFAAYLPDSVTHTLIEAALIRNRRSQDGGLTTRKGLHERLQQIRERRYACVDGTTIPGLRAASAPVLNAQGEAVAAITLISASENLTDPRNLSVHTMIDACLEISHKPF